MCAVNCTCESIVVQSSGTPPKAPSSVDVDAVANRNGWIQREFMMAALIVTVQFYLSGHVSIVGGHVNFAAQWSLLERSRDSYGSRHCPRPIP